MSTWLYAASNAHASANRTLALAIRHRIVWRSYYANRRPPIPIPNVKHLKSGDDLLLGYRDHAGVELLGRTVIRRAASPLTETPVFLRIPQSLLSEFADDYEPDPILGTIVGIAVDHVEPTSGRTQSPGRLTISAMDEPV